MASSRGNLAGEGSYGLKKCWLNTQSFSSARAQKIWLDPSPGLEMFFFKTLLERLLTTTVLCWFSCHETKVAVRMQKILSCDSVSGKVVFLLLCFNLGIFSFEGTSLLGKGKKALREDFVVMTVMQISPLERKKTDFYFCK